MADLYFGSARSDENGNITNGKDGDQKQTSTPDFSGEVSMQRFYVHKKGWVVMRPISVVIANKIADAMITACNNPNLGYNQNNRLGVILYGTRANSPTACDCSSLVRQCIKEATGIDVGNFNTSNEVDKLSASGIFAEPFEYTNKTVLYNGDVLVTKTKGHTGVMVYGSPRQNSPTPTSKTEYYPKCDSSYTSIVDALLSVGESDVTYPHRQKIAYANGIASYPKSNNEKQNIKMLNLLKNGTLKKS